MKQFAFLVIFAFIILLEGFAQSYCDSLINEVKFPKNDTTKIEALGALAHYYGYVRLDSSIYYSKQAVKFSSTIKSNYGEALGYLGISYTMAVVGNYPEALKMSLNSLHISEKLNFKSKECMAQSYRQIGLFNRIMGDNEKACSNLKLAISAQKESGAPLDDIYLAYSHLGIVLSRAKKIDSALEYAKKGYEMSLRSSKMQPDRCVATVFLGNIYFDSNRLDSAKSYYRIALNQCVKYSNISIMARVYRDLALVFERQNNLDSTIYYSHLALQICLANNFGDYASDVSKILMKIYESRNLTDSTLRYLKIIVSSKDSIFSRSRLQQFQSLVYDDEQRAKTLSLERERFNNRIRMILLFSAVGVLFFLAFSQYRISAQRKKAFLQMKEQKQLTEIEKGKAEDALSELKTTQAQLIQSEKMASLGELTAGIAHEIQNPLNFVNNFAEVNAELLQEMKTEIEKGNLTEIKNIANDLIDNEEKISQHDKRADSIVKGMLQHSKTSSGHKEPTDINSLADEYLRLSYHGFRAKDKNFNVTLQTDFDLSIGNIEVISQDIGRVFLNLFNNAFYAVNEKQKTESDGYSPAVSVSTKKSDGKIVIKISNNGIEIPDNIKDKIFQPFFTTKPTGQGTGLGLSLSYDIVKAHGGEIRLSGNGRNETEFTIDLPA